MHIEVGLVVMRVLVPPVNRALHCFDRLLTRIDGYRRPGGWTLGEYHADAGRFV